MPHSPKVALIVQARMNSSRLPGKIMKEVLGRPLLDFLIERLKKVKLADEVIVATTKASIDDCLVQLAKDLEVKSFRGSEDDVLARYYQAALSVGCKEGSAIVRVTSDCPLIDPQWIDRAIEICLSQNVDYVSNVHPRTFPRGMDMEVFSFKALELAYLKAKEIEEREHVTPYIYRHPEHFSQRSITFDADQSHHRWTVDTPQDFALIEKILNALYPLKPHFTLADLLELLQANPSWSAINSDVQQKMVRE